MKPIKIAPSILSANFGKLNEEIKEVEPYSDVLHIDVMDGHFVPNITIGPVVLKYIESKLPKHVHLMIEDPDTYAEAFAKAGADRIIFHIEVCPDPRELAQKIRDLGCKAGICLNPHTPLDTIEPYLDDVDMVLVMSVVPGFGGQSFMGDEALPKIKRLRELKPDIDIEVDGGVNDKTVAAVKEAGANIIVAGSYIFGSEDRVGAIEKLRNS